MFKVVFCFLWFVVCGLLLIVYSLFYLFVIVKEMRYAPDGSGKPGLKNCYFFLIKKSDQRKLLFCLRKIQF